VLAYLSRYTRRIAIASSRLVACDGERVTFKWKDYRAKADARYKLITLDADEFIRCFLIHDLPDGFHRIRHYGLFANRRRAENIARARQLLNASAPQNVPSDAESTGDAEPRALSNPCPCDGDIAPDTPRLSNPHGSSAPHRCTHAGPRFPPSRLVSRLPSERAALPDDGGHLITQR